MEPETNDLKLTPELEAIVRLASETAVESYRKELERQQEQDGKARRERHHRVVNSAKMLLKNYRRFKKMTVSSVYGKDTSTNETLVELLELIIRATKGKADIVPYGGNDSVYVFKLDNTLIVSNSLSTEDLVTKVKVVGQENKSGQSSVEATLTGLTEYGTRQRIYRRGSDEKLADAKSAAQAILDENGKVVEEVSVNAPDIPWLRKGHLVCLKAGTSHGMYYARGVVHNADSMTMTLDLLKAPDKDSDSGGKHAVGDIVNFHGGMHYVSSYADAKGYKATAGKAKITKDPSCSKNGGAHPWHLIHVDGSSNVYGWVDEGTFD